MFLRHDNCTHTALNGTYINAIGFEMCLELADHNSRHDVCTAWELVSTVSKARAWVEKNQMWPCADGGDPLSSDVTCYMTSAPDGLIVNTHPVQTDTEGCAERPEISIPLKLLCGKNVLGEGREANLVCVTTLSNL